MILILMVEGEARMEPPIQTEYFLSGGAMILILMVEGARAVISFCIRSAIPGYMVEGARAVISILMVEGARAVISFCIRSAIPGYMVVPPDMTVLAYRSLRMSTSHFMMELKVVSWMPQASIPRKEGWK